jgi:Skp family chaperone for outer membrane proteins
VAISVFTLASQAQQKIAVINYTNVLEGFWKTKQANIQLRDSLEDYQKTGRSMQDEYRKANEDYRKLIDTANDPAVSPEEKDKRKKAAETKLLELKEIEQSLSQLEKTADTNLTGMRRRLFLNIDRRIREVVSAKARAANYALVLNTSTLSANAGPVFLHVAGLDDLTDAVIAELNADAPKGALTETGKTDEGKDKTEGKPAEKKDDKKEDKK